MSELFLTSVIQIIRVYRELNDVKFYNDDPLVLRDIALFAFDRDPEPSLAVVDKATIPGLQRDEPLADP